MRKQPGHPGKGLCNVVKLARLALIPYPFSLRAKGENALNSSFYLRERDVLPKGARVGTRTLHMP